MHVIHEAFGPDANLYEILHVDTQSVGVIVDQAGLRKAYYKTALMYHPDKNQNNAMAVKKFQAVTAAYQILQDTEKRQIYDETGEFGGLDDDDDIGGTSSNSSNNPWMDYFDRIFGRVTVDGIAEFAQSYKCSEEEKSHVLEQYVNTKGNMVKMLDYVMLSTSRDAERWVVDYLRPAIAAGTITDQYQSTMEKTFQKLQAKVKKEDEQEERLPPPRQQQDDDQESTESDDDDSSSSAAVNEQQETSSKRKKQPPKKPAASSQKRQKAAVGEDDDNKNNKKKKKNDMSSLIAQIQNKTKSGGSSSNSMADFAARYGVTDFDAADDDPLADDDAFRRAQARVVHSNESENRM
jgi:DnaJ homolog subfamily C member 9